MIEFYIKKGPFLTIKMSKFETKKSSLLNLFLINFSKIFKEKKKTPFFSSLNKWRFEIFRFFRKNSTWKIACFFQNRVYIFCFFCIKKIEKLKKIGKIGPKKGLKTLFFIARKMGQKWSFLGLFWPFFLMNLSAKTEKIRFFQKNVCFQNLYLFLPKKGGFLTTFLRTFFTKKKNEFLERARFWKKHRFFH